LNIDATGQDIAGGRSAALTELSAKLRDAWHRGDATGLQGLVAEDFTVVDASGAVRALQDAPGGEAVSAAATTWAVRDYGTVAMVTARTPAPAGGEEVALDVWVRQGQEWRALLHHLNLVADPASPSRHPAPAPRPPEAPPAECKNPCEFVPYDAASQAERDIIATFQALETAVIHNDADEWVNHMADEFMVYRTRQHPTSKLQRAGHLRAQKAANSETFVAAVEAMRLWVHGDAAVMRADHVMPGNRRPPYRATRVWVKRDGRWQMAVSQQTTRAG
jgi:ketosteroid isomerase-like protein